MEKKKNDFNDMFLKKKIQKMIKFSKEKKLIKSLSSAFETTLCEKEEHKGKIFMFISE